MANQGEYYIHYKGGFYGVICRAVDEATRETVVVYKNRDTNVAFVRPVAEFHELVVNEFGIHVERFKKTNEQEYWNGVPETRRPV